jgi:hypothetical protein
MEIRKSDSDSIERTYLAFYDLAEDFVCTPLDSTGARQSGVDRNADFTKAIYDFVTPIREQLLVLSEKLGNIDGLLVDCKLIDEPKSGSMRVPVLPDFKAILASASQQWTWSKSRKQQTPFTIREGRGELTVLASLSTRPDWCGARFYESQFESVELYYDFAQSRSYILAATDKAFSEEVSQVVNDTMALPARLATQKSLQRVAYETVGPVLLSSTREQLAPALAAAAADGFDSSGVWLKSETLGKWTHGSLKVEVTSAINDLSRVAYGGRVARAVGYGPQSHLRMWTRFAIVPFNAGDNSTELRYINVNTVNGLVIYPGLVEKQQNRGERSPRKMSVELTAEAVFDLVNHRLPPSERSRYLALQSLQSLDELNTWLTTTTDPSSLFAKLLQNARRDRTEVRHLADALNRVVDAFNMATSRPRDPQVKRRLVSTINQLKKECALETTLTEGTDNIPAGTKVSVSFKSVAKGYANGCFVFVSTKMLGQGRQADLRRSDSLPIKFRAASSD